MIRLIRKRETKEIIIVCSCSDGEIEFMYDCLEEQKTKASDCEWLSDDYEINGFIKVRGRWKFSSNFGEFIEESQIEKWAKWEDLPDITAVEAANASFQAFQDKAGFYDHDGDEDIVF